MRLARLLLLSQRGERTTATVCEEIMGQRSCECRHIQDTALRGEVNRSLKIFFEPDRDVPAAHAPARAVSLAILDRGLAGRP